MITFVKNNRKVYSIILVFSMLIYSLFGSIGVTFASANTSQTSDAVELKILHTNDLHAKIKEFGKIAAYIKQERANATNSLFLDAGDIFSGNPVVDLQYGEPIVELLNIMGLQAMVIGNHDFDYGQEQTIKRINQSQFPWLSANMIVGDGAHPDFPQPDPYKIFDVNGISVGVLALTETPPSTAPANVVGIQFNNPIETARQYEYLKDEVDVFIALTHHGYSEDMRLAENVDFFDLIIGGHSHTTLSSPRIINGTPIVQTGGNAENVGNVTINLHPETNEIISVDGFLQRVANLTEVDEEVQAKVDAYYEKMDELLGEVLGETETGLNRSGNGDTQLGNFWTDSMRHFTNADIALTNNGGLRANIPAGEITVNDIFTIEPFANAIMKIEMTGTAVKDVIEYSYKRRSSVDLQTSGLHYKIITNNTGRYVDSVLTVNGQPIQDDETYTVVVGDYIGTGGSGYNFDGTILESDSGQMTDAMIAYAKYLTNNNQKINYSNNQRIFLEVSNDAPIVGNPIGSTVNGLSAANNSKGDSGLGNLYTDSVRSVTGADVGLLNSSSVSGSIAPGVITDGQIEFLDRFGNAVVVTKTTVARVKEVLLEQAKYNNGVDVQASGLHYELVKENGRFVEVIVKDTEGSVLSDSTELTIAYNDYMHGAGFYNLGSELIGENHPKVWEAVVQYVTNHDGPIDYVEGSRITISGEEVQPPGDLPPGVITVAEAISNNNGAAKVQGYIVGTQGVFEGNFVNTNLVLADNPNERDASKLLPVQLPSGAVRAALNLVDNPENLGKLVRIEGNLAAYFSKPGLRDAKAYEFVEIQGNKLADIRELSQGSTVEASGIVTSTPGAWGAKGFYIQDETAGLYVFQSNHDVKVGDKVTVSGKLGNFNQELQVTDVSGVKVLSSNNELPETLKLTPGQVTLDNQGQLVTLEGVTIADLKPSGTFGTFEFQAVKGDESILVRVDNRTGLVYNDFMFKNGDVVNVSGASSRFHDTIQVKPRGAADIVAFVEEEEEEREFLTVAEAIANNSGEGTVRGYIIGTMTNNQPSYDGNFVATNLVIADSLDERDRSKVLPVMLPTGAVRSGLNLVDNPTNYGQYIEVTGNLAAYFSQPGLRDTKSYKFIEIEVEEDTIVTEDEINIEEVEENGKLVVEIKEDSNDLTFTAEALALLQGVKDVKIEIKKKLVTMNIPLSILATDQAITFTMEEASYEGAVGPVFNFTIKKANGEKISEFNEPVTLTFKVNVENVKEVRDLKVYYINGGLKEEVPSNYVIEDGFYVVTAEVNHFSMYGVFEEYVAPEVTSEATTSFVDGKEKEVKKLARNLDVKVESKISNHLRDAKKFNVTVTLVDKHGRVKHNVEEEVTVQAEGDFTFTHELKVPTNHVGQRYTLTVTVTDEEGNVISQESIK